LVAFGLYILLVGVLSGIGRQLAPAGHPAEFKAGPYASGEASPERPALLGYQSFFQVALFFAILHLGILVLSTTASGGRSLAVIMYLAGLALSLTLLLVG
jgi:NADH:ubiquinone oxidoreductase subunit 3 (subunit A)